MTTLIANETLWRTLALRVRAARRVHAAVAYLGQGGAKRLALKRGDCLVVDMSPSTVRTGTTDPREIEKFIRRGVRVFTRRNLHAKLVLADGWVIVGSANISRQAEKVLDEAAILTNEPAAVRRGREFIERLCTEPVRPEYLKECKLLYRPPRFHAERTDRKPRQKRVQHAKLWLVKLRDYDLPDSEMKRYKKGELRAKKLVKNAVQSKTDSFFWPSKPKMTDELQTGDWLIEVITHEDKSILVYPPAQLLLIDHYVRKAKKRKERWVFHLEIPRRGEPMSWRKFRGAAKRYIGDRGLKSPRTKAIRDVRAADSLLGLWTVAGRVSRQD